MGKDFWAWFLVSVFWGTNGVFLCFVGEQSLELGSLLFPQIVQYPHKDIFPSPQSFVFRICLCLAVGSRTPHLFSNSFSVHEP